MTDHADRAERLKGIAAEEIERHPYGRELLEAFLPLFVARGRFFGPAPAGTTALVALDPVQFLAGVPLLLQNEDQGPWSLFPSVAPWQEMMTAVVAAMEEGFPTLQDDLGRLKVAIAAGGISLCDAFAVNGEGTEKIIGRWSMQLSVAAGTLDFVLDQSKRFALHARQQELAAIVAGSTWQKGYCPICGGLPSLAWIREKGGERRLHCAQCGHEWVFSRVSCPVCEAQEPEGIPFFFIAGNEREAAFACDHCKKYLVTLHQVADWDDRDPDLAAIGMAHLDLLMQEKGFSPMAASGWNAFAQG